jgi:hypothetical protein
MRQFVARQIEPILEGKVTVIFFLKGLHLFGLIQVNYGLAECFSQTRLFFFENFDFHLLL